MSQLPVAPIPPAAQVPAHLVESTSRYVESGLRGAANTIRAYAGDWKRFTAWCAIHEMESLPASSEASAGFLTELADAGKKVATIQRHAAAMLMPSCMHSTIDSRQACSVTSSIRGCLLCNPEEASVQLDRLAAHNEAAQ